MLEAEGAHVGLSPGLEGLSFRVDGRGDGGIDALVASEPDRPSQLIPARWVFQAKTSLDLSKLKSQLKGKAQARARKLLRAGGGYTLVVNAHLNAEETVAQLNALLKAVVGRRVKARVIAREHLASWLVQHPQLVSLVPGLTDVGRHLRDFHQWDSSLGGRLPWTPDDARSAASRRIAQLPAGSICRVLGAAGVGKSRLVLEALRARAQQVSYLPVYRDEAESLVGRDAPMKGVLVVDECSTEQHERLSRLHSGELILITVGVDDDRTLSRRDEELLVMPLTSSAMRSLADCATAHVDRETKLELASLSGGYPKYLDVLLEAVAAEPRRADRLSLSDVQRLTDRLLSGFGSLESIRALAVAKWVDLSPGTTDSELLAAAAEISEASLRRTLGELRKRGLAGQRDHNWYVTPRILAERLALDFWGDASAAKERFRALVRSGGDRGLIERCVMRLEDGSAQARALLVELARDPALLRETLTHQQQFRLIQKLAVIQPQQALDVAESLFHSAAQWTNEVSVALGLISQNASCFDRAVRLLIDHLVRAPEGADRGVLLDLFRANGPLTKAPSAQRIKALHSLSQSSVAAQRHLAIDCARAGCTRELAYSAGGFEFERPWQTNEQELDYRTQAAGILCALMRDPEPELRLRAANAAASLVRQQAYEGFASVAVVLVSGLVEAQASLDEVRRELDNIAEFDSAAPGIAEAMEQIKKLLEPRTLRDRFSALLASWRFDYQPEKGALSELKELALNLVAQPDEEVLRFLSDSGPGRFRAGQELAGVDVGHHFLSRILIALERPGASTQFAAGYLQEVPDSEAEPVLDAWAGVPNLGMQVLDLTARRALTPAGVARITRLADAGALRSGWHEIIKGRYLWEKPEARVLLRPLLEPSPMAWLDLAEGAVTTDKDKVAAVEELQLAWRAAFASADFNDSDWKHATRKLVDHNLGFVHAFGLSQLRESHVFPTQLLDVVETIVSPWAEFAAALETLTPEEQRRVSRTIRTRAWGVRPAEALGWIGQDESRLLLVAMMAPSVTEHSDNLAAGLLDAWPRHDILAQLIYEHFNRKGFPSGTILDATARAAEGELGQLRRLAESARPGVSKWARRFVSEHERIARERHGNEEADELGMSGGREPGQKISQAIYKLAESQEGYFSADQAKKSGCSAQLLRRYQQTGKIVRVRRSVYRLRQFPAGEHEDLVVVWLWSARKGVFSHATALTLHGLSNVIAESHEVTLPARQEARRLKIPDGVRLHFADIAARDRVAVGPFWATSVERTLADCAAVGVSDEILREARDDAKRRGLIP